MPRGRIQFTFTFQGVRYRPTLPIVPTTANLRLRAARLPASRHASLAVHSHSQKNFRLRQLEEGAARAIAHL
jgi:Arm domain-containing DNA-binding protein